MKLSVYQKIMISPACFYAIFLGVSMNGLMLEQIILDQISTVLICCLNIPFVITGYCSYSKTNRMLQDGVFVDGQVFIIRSTQHSRKWVLLKYFYNDQVITKELELSINDLNKDMSVHLLLDKENSKQFRVLSPTDQHEPEMKANNVVLYGLLIMMCWAMWNVIIEFF